MPGELLARIETRGERPEDSLGQNPFHPQPRDPEHLLGIDLGAAEVKMAAFNSNDAALCQARAASRGNPLAALLDVLSQLPEELRAGPVRIAVTGSGQYLLDHLPSCLRTNEALATALAVRRAFPGARTVIDLGGLSSKWILLGRGAQDTVVDFSSNGLCAAGAGAFLEQQAGRLGLTLDRLGNMAAVASKGASIAGRCSVFAKSDMIHLQQKGTPLEEIAYGLCQALARTFLTTVAQGRSEAPIVLVGGGATNPGLVRAFREQLALGGDALIAPEDALFFGAAGAARMARDAPPVEFSRFLAAVRERAHAGSARHVASALPPLAPCQPESRPEPTAKSLSLSGTVEAYLGLDVGSVSTNLALLTPDFEVIEGIYLPTRGRPVEALHQGLSQIQRGVRRAAPHPQGRGHRKRPPSRGQGRRRRRHPQ